MVLTMPTARGVMLHQHVRCGQEAGVQAALSTLPEPPAPFCNTPAALALHLLLLPWIPPSVCLPVHTLQPATHPAAPVKKTMDTASPKR